LLQKFLAKEPTDRFATAEQAAQALRAALVELQARERAA